MPLDLIADLPKLLPSAIVWAESSSRSALANGRPLDADELALALGVGVNQPHGIRLIIVDQLPRPADPLLKRAADETGLLGPNMIGLTLGYAIFIVRGHLDRRLLSHECRHVHQYEEYGSIAEFLPEYLEQVVTVGYHNSSFERDARAHEVLP